MSLLIKPLPCLLLPIIFIIFSSTLHSTSHGAPSADLHSQTNHIPGAVDESENGVVGWGVRRSVLENSSTLAAQRTRRKDPLNNFNYYTGGWNISNKHYFAALLALPFFSLLQSGLSDLACVCSSSAAVFAAAAANLMAILELLMHSLIGCIVLYTGQGQFHSTTSETLDYVVRQANTTVANLENVSDYLAAAKSIGIDQVSLPTDVQNNIGNVDNEISSAATTLQSETKNNKKNIEDVLDTVILALIIIAAVMLLLALLGFRNILNSRIAVSCIRSGPHVPLLCNPFNADLSNRTCAAGELDFENATQVWQNYVCQVSSNNTCTTVGRLTPAMYSQMINAANVSYGLYHYGPFLVGLLDCRLVRETFTAITQEHCPDLKRYSMWVYIGLAMVSAAVMLSLIFWVIYARERRHRKYTKLVNAQHGDHDDSFGEKRP
ncbi:hypothetical protein C3L33_00374, partial [Rhododendron williamsianum]